MAWRHSRNKFGARKTEIDGITFDSQREAQRYTELKWLEKAGKIQDLELQKKFVLQPKYKKGGKTVREISYIADFVYSEDGRQIVEDCKGMKTEVYKLKKKIFEYKYPELSIRET